ncbi:MAG TPA: ABC transporter permease subunit [Pseudolysinimonas sp.]|nr:ABC transporter permease subunit [Pseudolysinimonas sp.]
MTRKAVLWGLAGIVLIIVVWELYKNFAPADGIVLFAVDGERRSGIRVLPRASDRAMPHIWDMFAALFQPVSGQGTPVLINLVALGVGRTLGYAAVGWIIALVVALVLALVMQRWRVAEWGVLPWVVVSQTVPLIAFAPILATVGFQLNEQGIAWPQWLTVSVIASYLAFFPMTVGALRGLKAPERTQLELMRTYAAGYWATLVKLRLPAAVPHLLPALRLGATTAIIGAIVAEVSIGVGGGIGGLLIGVAAQGTSDPAKPWGPVFGAVALGFIAVGVVAVIGLLLRRFRRQEATA